MALLRELFEHDRSEGVQPLVLCFDIAGELATLGFPRATAYSTSSRLSLWVTLSSMVLDMRRSFSTRL